MSILIYNDPLEFSDDLVKELVGDVGYQSLLDTDFSSKLSSNDCYKNGVYHNYVYDSLFWLNIQGTGFLVLKLKSGETHFIHKDKVHNFEWNRPYTNYERGIFWGGITATSLVLLGSSIVIMGAVGKGIYKLISYFKTTVDAIPEKEAVETIEALGNVCLLTKGVFDEDEAKTISVEDVPLLPLKDKELEMRIDSEEPVRKATPIEPSKFTYEDEETEIMSRGIKIVFDERTRTKRIIVPPNYASSSSSYSSYSEKSGEI